MHPNLRTFLDLLTRENEIATIDAEVDPYLEVAEVHRRVIDRGGPALLFKRVKGSRYPVVTNLFGTKQRIDLAFGPKPEALVRKLVEIAEFAGCVPDDAAKKVKRIIECEVLTGT